MMFSFTLLSLVMVSLAFDMGWPGTPPIQQIKDLTGKYKNPVTEPSSSSTSGQLPKESIRICNDFTSLDTIPKENKTYSNKIIQYVEGAASVISQFLKVIKPQENNIIFNDKDIEYLEMLYEVIKIPDKHKTEGMPNCDFLLYASYFVEESDSIILSMPIQLGQDKRPQIGTLWFNLYNFTEQPFQQGLRLTIGAFLHNLAFDSRLFENFLAGTYYYYEEESKRYYLESPQLLKEAQKHFDCDSLIRIPLENGDLDSDGGNFYERSFMINDVMSPYDRGNNVITAMTLAVLNDSGWYEVDMGFAEDTIFGKNKGCEFISDCTSFQGGDQEFCDKIDEIGLDFFFRGIGKCQKYKSTDTCPLYLMSTMPDQIDCYNANQKGVQEIFLQVTFQNISKTSVAFLSDLRKAGQTIENDLGFRCFEYKIKDDDITILLNGSDQTIECLKQDAGNNHNFSDEFMEGSFTCPSERLWEFKTQNCFEECGSTGYCHKGECLLFKQSSVGEQSSEEDDSSSWLLQTIVFLSLFYL